MLLNCTRQLKLVYHYDIQRSIVASLTAGSVFTSFRPSVSKRADVKLHNRTLLPRTVKKMDASSIITQVSRDQDQYNGYHPSPPDDSKGNWPFQCCQICSEKFEFPVKCSSCAFLSLYVNHPCRCSMFK